MLACWRKGGTGQERAYNDYQKPGQVPAVDNTKPCPPGADRLQSCAAAAGNSMARLGPLRSGAVM